MSFYFFALHTQHRVNSRLVSELTAYRPTAVDSNITVDLSKAGLDSLLPSSISAHVSPTTIVKAGEVVYKAGRTMGMTEGWVAYGLSKGESPGTGCGISVCDSSKVDRRLT